MALAFEQQEKESDKAFAAFSLYLSLGPERSLAVVAKRLQKSVTMLGRWSSKFDWPARVKAHGAYMGLVEREAAEALARARGVDWVKRQEEEREKEWELRCRLVRLAETAIERWLANPVRCGSLEGIARLLDLATRLGRLSSGLPTDRTETSVEVEAKLDVDWEMALRKVYGPTPSKVIDVEASAGLPQKGEQKTLSQ